MKKIVFLVLLLLTTTLQFVFAGLVLSPVQGTYSRNISLSIKSNDNSDVYYKFSTSTDTNYVKYSSPLYLSAAEGEYRVYTIIIAKKQKNNFIPVIPLKYIIDKSIPPMPSVSFKGGVFNHDISLKFLPVAVKYGKLDTFFKLTGDASGSFVKWNGNPLKIRQTDILQNISLIAYSQNSSGMKSTFVYENYTVLPKSPSKTGINILSPVNGLFANSQLLYIDTTGFKWVRYSLGSSDPAKFGTTYHSPVLFKSKGEYILNVAGLLLNSTKIIKKTLKFTIQSNQNIINDLPQGIYTGEIAITLNKTGILYSLGSPNTQNASLIKYKSPIKIHSIPGIRKFVSLYVFDKGTKYRYFYVSDNRIPGAPVINSSIDNKRKILNMEILAGTDSEVRYTTDGSTPDRFSTKYTGPFSVKLTRFNTTGSVIIKAASFLSNKQQSSIAAKLVNFDFQPPDKPLGEVKKIDKNTYKLIITNIENNSLYYSINYDGSKPDEFERDTFLGSGENTYRFPIGFTGDIAIKTTLEDNSGNISEPAYFTFHVDTQAPPPPNVTFKGSEIFLASGLSYVGNKNSNKIYYTLLKYKKELFGSSLKFKQFTAPLDLVQIKNKTYIAFYSVDESENRSPIVIRNLPVIEGSKLFFNIKYSGVENGGIYKNNREITFYNDERIDIYYSISSDGTEPGLPVLSDENKIVKELRFNCEENEEKNYFLKILAVLRENPKISKIIKIKFTIDKRAPSIPVITSIKDGDTLKGPVSIDVKSDANNEVYVVCRNTITDKESKSQQFYRNNGVLYTGRYFVDIPKGNDKRFELSAAAFDQAGNFSHSNQIITFKIDNKAPISPVISFINVKDISKGDFKLQLTSEEGTSIYYAVSHDGNALGFTNSTEYKKPVFFKADTDSISNFLIKAWAIDKAGNISIRPAVKSLSVSKTRIHRIEPQILYGKGAQVFISFPDKPDYTCFYKLGNGNFQKYNYPVSIFADRSSRNLFYYTSDSFGNKSPLGSKVIRSLKINSNLITGILNKGLYRDSVTVKKINNSVAVKYEAGVKGSYVPEVSYFSPEIPDELKFTASDGETLSIVLKVKAYDMRNNIPVSEEKEYSFSIDKSIPDPPIITGAENNKFYQNGRSIRLNAKEGKIFYKLSSGNTPSEKFIEYSAPLRLDTGKGTFKKYNLEAYTLDRAGNRSGISSLHFSIDKAVVYLSSKGKDIYDGSRSRPFRTLSKALEFALKSSRNTIYMTEGEFTLDNGVLLKRDLHIIGGFNINNWEKGKEKTLITKEDSSLNFFPLFKVTSGKVTLDNIAMANFGLQSPLVVQNDGDITITNCDMILADNRGRSAIVSKNGKLKIQDTNVIIGATKISNVFPVTGSYFTADNLNIRADNSYDNLTLFNFKNVKYSSMDNIGLKLKGGQVIQVFNLDNSNLNINKSKFDIGLNKRSASFFSLNNSALNVRNSSFNSKSRVSSFLDAGESKISVDSSRLNMEGDIGLSVFNIEKSGLTIDQTDFALQNATEFIYSIQFTDSDVEINNSLFKTGKTSDLKYLEAHNSTLTFKNNVVNLDESSEKNSVFTLKDMKVIKIMDNDVVRKGAVEKQLPIFEISGDNKALIADNSFKGFTAILNFNGISITKPEDLNSYRGLVPAPYGNVSK